MADVLPQPPPASNANRGLWMLVIGLGIAILLVIAAMIGMAIRQAYLKPPPGASSTITAIPGAVPELALDLPVGATVGDARLEAGTLVVHVTSPTGDELFIIDPRQAKLISRVKLNKPAGAPAP